MKYSFLTVLFALLVTSAQASTTSVMMVIDQKNDASHPYYSVSVWTHVEATDRKDAKADTVVTKEYSLSEAKELFPSIVNRGYTKFTGFLKDGTTLFKIRYTEASNFPTYNTSTDISDTLSNEVLNLKENVQNK